jgi:hypothetical protein
VLSYNGRTFLMTSRIRSTRIEREFQMEWIGNEHRRVIKTNSDHCRDTENDIKVPRMLSTSLQQPNHFHLNHLEQMAGPLPLRSGLVLV